MIAGGLFAETVVRAPLITPGDAAATSHAIAAHLSLWRWGLAVHLLYHLPAVVLYVLLYRLFRPVHATLARGALLFAAVSLTVEAVALLHLYVPVMVLEEATALAGLAEPQLQAMTYLAGWVFALLHFAGFCVATGLLILRSALVPRAIGWLLVAAGACYLVNSLTHSFTRDLSDVLVPWILLPALVGERSFALWLTIKGTRHDGVHP